MLIKNILKHKYKILAVGYSIWLTAISLTPQLHVKLLRFNHIDKFGHFLLYFFLVIFWLLAYPKLNRQKIQLILITIAWGILIEFMQAYLIPGRSGDWLDAVANTVGGLVGLFFYQKFLLKNKPVTS